MTIPRSCQIHPTAIVSPEVELADGVVVGPYSILEGNIKIGPECVIKSHAYLCGAVTMGRGNQIFSGAILGEKPQHLKYNGEPTGVVIGDNNIFRENVTIHRATPASGVTRIGNNNFFMAGSHVAHDCVVGNHCIFANNALLGGHCTVADHAFLSGNTAVHQFVRIGRLVLLSGCSGTTKDIPPFMIQYERNIVVGVNVIGMRRAGMGPKQIEAIRRVFHIVFRQNLTLPESLARIEEEVGQVESVQEFLSFMRNCSRGVGVVRSRRHNEAA